MMSRVESRILSHVVYVGEGNVSNTVIKFIYSLP